MLLSANMLSMLTEQYRHEILNSLRYDQRRAWCEAEGFIGSAAFWKQEAEGERGHANKVLGFLIDRSAKPVLEPLTFDDNGDIS